MSALKKELYKKCLDYIKNRMEAAQFAIEDAQRASNDDTKSSAGDKYETGRAMMQQETGRNLAQLNEANKLKVALSSVNTSGTSETAEVGSVVLTNNGNFYIAISAGELTVANKSYFTVSPASPIGSSMKGKKAGDNFVLNGKLYYVEMVI